MSNYYPPGTFELPGEKEVEKTYVFEVIGEIEVEAYSEEDAEEQLKENLSEILAGAVRDGSLYIN